MEKIINFEPGYDYIYGIPKKDSRYGRHGMQIRFSLIGKEGAVTFLMFTDWLPMVKVDEIWKPTYFVNINRPMFPMAADIGFHSPKPIYEGQTKVKSKCKLIGNKPCYYDGSSLYAEDFMAELINKGLNALWNKMEKYYKETFKNKTRKG